MNMLEILLEKNTFKELIEKVIYAHEKVVVDSGKSVEENYQDFVDKMSGMSHEELARFGVAAMVSMINSNGKVVSRPISKDDDLDKQSRIEVISGEVVKDERGIFTKAQQNDIKKHALIESKELLEFTQDGQVGDFLIIATKPVPGSENIEQAFCCAGGREEKLKELVKMVFQGGKKSIKEPITKTLQ